MRVFIAFSLSVIEYTQGSSDGRAGNTVRKVRASQGRMPANYWPEQSEGKRNRNYTAIITATVKRCRVKAHQV